MCFVSTDGNKGRSDAGRVEITLIVLGSADCKIMPESCQIASKMFPLGVGKQLLFLRADFPS